MPHLTVRDPSLFNFLRILERCRWPPFSLSIDSRHADDAPGHSYNRIVRKCYVYSVIFVTSQTRTRMYTGMVGDDKEKYYQSSRKSNTKQNDDRHIDYISPA